MYICICHSVTEKAIKRCVHQGHDTFAAVQKELKVATGCGRCKWHVCETIEEALETPAFFNLDITQGALA